MGDQRLRPGQTDRDVAFAVLGQPANVLRIHGSIPRMRPDGWLEIKLSQIYPPEEADTPGFGYEWACGGALPGTACTAEEFEGVFSLVTVCFRHSDPSAVPAR